MWMKLLNTNKQNILIYMAVLGVLITEMMKSHMHTSSWIVVIIKQWAIYGKLQLKELDASDLKYSYEQTWVQEYENTWHPLACVSHSVHLCAGFPEGSGVGASAAAEPLEEVALPQGGEGSAADSTDAGEGHSTSIQSIPQVTT